MKKLLSFVLVLAMVLGCVSMSFAAYSDMKDSKYATAVDTLSNLGVVDGFTDGTFGPEKTLTRAQMAKLLVCALALDPAGATGASFSDVAASAWYAPYVELSAQLGIVNGYPDGTFKPEKLVSNTEAIVMVVRALGYTDDYFGGYNATKYINKAVGLKLMGDVATGTAGSTRGNAAQLLYNALDASIVSLTSNDALVNALIGAQGSSDTMMKRLSGADYMTGAAFVYDGTQTAAKGVNLTAYLGKYVTAYTPAGKPGEIAGIKTVKSTTLTGYWDGTNFVADGVKYTLNGSPATGSNLTFLSGTTSVCAIKNGKLDAAGVTNGAIKDKNNPVELNVTLTGKRIDAVYSVVLWTVSSDFTFTAGDFNEAGLSLKGKKFAALEDDSTKIDYASFELLGAASLKDIKAKDVVYVYVNSKDSTITKVVVGTTVLEGTVSKVSSAGKYTIDGTEYALANATGLANAVTSINAKAEGTFRLDYFGKIYSTTAADPTNYGILIDAKNGSSDNFETKLAKVIIVDAKTAAKATYEVKKGVAGLMNGTTGANQYTFAFPTAAGFVKYNVNSEGQVDALTTGGFTVATATNVKVYSDGVVSASGMNGYLVNSDTVVLYKAADGTYSSGSYADLLGTDACTMAAVYKDGKILYAVVENAASTKDNLYVAVDYYDDGTSGKQYVQTIMNVKTGEKSDVRSSENKKATKSGIESAIYKLTWTNDVAKLTAPSTALSTPGSLGTSPTAFKTTASALDGRIFKYANGTTVVIAETPVVWVWDATNSVWAAGTTADLNGLNKDTCTVDFFKTDSKLGAYDLVFVVK